MPFDRRWLLTAAGSAFLASLAEEGLGAPPPNGAQVTGDLAKDRDAAFEEFRLGYGELDAAQAKLSRKALEDVYLERFDRIYPTLDSTKQQLLLGFAYALGNLTFRCLENERAGRCGWKKDEKATLREDHVRWARELLGFHLNTCLKEKCGAPPSAAKVRQADMPCPLC